MGLLNDCDVGGARWDARGRVAASKNQGERERESLKKESEVEDDDTIEKVVVVV